MNSYCLRAATLSYYVQGRFAFVVNGLVNNQKQLSVTIEDESQRSIHYLNIEVARKRQSLLKGFSSVCIVFFLLFIFVHRAGRKGVRVFPAGDNKPLRRPSPVSKLLKRKRHHSKIGNNRCSNNGQGA